ncbi:hypothetical protein SAMN04488137_4761 [Fictibacillus solisalsi]|uniref:Uncharacterized protein n=1 Tax=Fictibacillus solisalsi TaxID=459525 RepID=A0A1H0C2Q9_9BACL|nr:hypothetical protein SAMN04488137_4761 [Fictibacillus solisalsi]
MLLLKITNINYDLLKMKKLLAKRSLMFSVPLERSLCVSTFTHNL